jgi:hypothetical protein
MRTQCKFKLKKKKPQCKLKLKQIFTNFYVGWNGRVEPKMY